mgnify:CR=1 FL=1|jgi:hypothetical protein
MVTMTQAAPADIGKLAQQIQQQAATARHLAQTVSQDVCDLDGCEDCQPGRKDAEERMLLFADLIQQVAEKIGAIALKVEEADFHLRFNAAKTA